MQVSKSQTLPKTGWAETAEAEHRAVMKAIKRMVTQIYDLNELPDIPIDRKGGVSTNLKASLLNFLPEIANIINC